MYFFIPSGIPGGRYVVYMGLTKATWLWMHNKAGIFIIILVAAHLIIHWQWIVHTTRSFFRKKKKNSICNEKSGNLGSPIKKI
ncbi:hypothetical protein [Methanosarcina sp.]|uniref:hypothetical protein n=1 Tax=Methanosarcina sp. TaxID=2213 RepID=UPI003C767DAC